MSDHLKNTLLIEVLTEELPPVALLGLGQSFLRACQETLSLGGFIDTTSQGVLFASPRRLAVQFTNCLSVSPQKTLTKKGPAVSRGLDSNGTPTKALEGFLKSSQVDLAQCKQEDYAGQLYFTCSITTGGNSLTTELSNSLEPILKKLPSKKAMNWGTQEASRFVRPVRGLVVLHGSQVLDITIFDIKSTRTTRGHRFMTVANGLSQIVTIDHADQYEQALHTKGYVIASYEKRQKLIQSQLEKAALKQKLTYLENQKLLDEVTGLVEWPEVYLATFDPSFLSVPKECLILAMQSHQKYFPLLESNQQLHSSFLVVSNMALPDPSRIIKGNEKVVQARLADAAFFFTTDQNTPLGKRVEQLQSVVFFQKLGTQHDRTLRLVTLTEQVANLLGCDKPLVKRAALLSKTDLVTDMVAEFPELQGTMGRHYALAQKEDSAVCLAIEEHYFPRFNDDLLPSSDMACALGIADRMDKIAGFFSIGKMPTGEKDPFALRRAAIGVLRILTEKKLPLNLSHLIDWAMSAYPFSDQVKTKSALEDFFTDRLRVMLKENHDINIIDAVLTTSSYKIYTIFSQLDALKDFCEHKAAMSVIAANKRIGQILKKTPPADMDQSHANLLLKTEYEKKLLTQLEITAKQVASAIENGRYHDAMSALENLDEPINSFFEKTMIMVEEKTLRQARLGLLKRTHGILNQAANLDYLQRKRPS